MEVTGFIIGVASLAGLYNSCINCFDQVQRAREFGLSYETCRCKLSVIHLRFARWGEGLGLRKRATDGSSTSEISSRLSDAEAADVERIMKGIVDIFKALETDCEKIEQTKKKARVPQTESEAVPPDRWYRHKLLRLAKRHSNNALQSVREAGGKVDEVTLKIKWAILKEKRFRRLLEDVTELVDELTELFPDLQPELDHMCGKDVVSVLQARRQTVTTDATLRHELEILNNIVEEDPMLKKGLQRAINSLKAKSRGYNVTTDASSIFMIGDYYADGQTGQSLWTPVNDFDLENVKTTRTSTFIVGNICGGQSPFARYAVAPAP